MINEHYYDPHARVGQEIHEVYSKPLHTGWNVSISEVHKMISTKLHPKYLHFRHFTKVTSMRQLTSYLVDAFEIALIESKKNFRSTGKSMILHPRLGLHPMIIP